MPAAATVDAWNEIVNKSDMPRDQWLRIVTNRIVNSGDAEGTLVAEYAIVDETGGTVHTNLCSDTVTLAAGSTAGLTFVGDEAAGAPVCQLTPLETDQLAPLMYKFQTGDPDPLVFAFRTYVDGNTPPPWPGQDEGSGGQTARTTVNVAQGELPVIGNIPGLSTAQSKVVAGAGAGSVAATVLSTLIGK